MDDLQKTLGLMNQQAARTMYLEIYSAVFPANYIHDVRSEANYLEPEQEQVSAVMAHSAASAAVIDVFGEEALAAILDETKARRLKSWSFGEE